MSIKKAFFGKDEAGHPVDLITMTNRQGASVGVINYGASIQSIRVPDAMGALADIALGFDDMQGYRFHNSAYMGATVGRYANRIRGARFSLNGQNCYLTNNEGSNTLHGGQTGFDRRWYTYMARESAGEDLVAMHYVSHDGEEGFPGKMKIQVVFSFSDDNRLTINYRALSDKDTVVNLTNHSYFNLDAEGDVLDQALSVFSDTRVAVDGQLLPTGDLLSVEGSVYDLRKAKTLRECLNAAVKDLSFTAANGFDTAYCLAQTGSLVHAARAFSARSGRVMDVYTDRPSVQLYTGQGLNVDGKNGAHYADYAGFAMETQAYPDAVHFDHFPSTVLSAGESFSSTTQYAFSIYKAD